MSPICSVLMTADTRGGAFSYALELASALASAGVRTTLATMGRLLSPAQRRAAASVRELSLFESTYRTDPIADPWDDIARAGEWLLSLEKRIKPDIVHLNGLAHGAIPFRAPSLVVARPSYLRWLEAAGASLSPAPCYAEASQSFAAAAAVVAPTQATLDAILRRHGPCARAVVIPNAIDPERYRLAPKADFIVATGRLWDPGKNMAALNEVASRLPWPVRVAGSLSPPGQAQVSVPSLEHLGELSRCEIKGVLSRAAIYALPARDEPFGLSILEAALSGCALVLGDLPGLLEIWGDSAALYISPDDPAELEATLLALIKNPIARAEMGLRARDRARSYMPRQMTARYVALYAELDKPPVLVHNAPVGPTRAAAKGACS